MSMYPQSSGERSDLLDVLRRPTQRRSFLKATGAAALILTGAGCDDIFGDDDDDRGDVVIDFSRGDVAVLNFAFALEQLEAAFYTRVAASFYAGVTAEERAVLEDIRDHEIAHREFFRRALGIEAIRTLEPDFSQIDFSDRTSVLQTAQVFEDLGVSAYNGAGQFLTSADFLTVAGKIVSVEARHAEAIRDLREPPANLFSVVDAQGLDAARLPGEVLDLVAPFIRTRITLRNAPTA